MSVKGVVKGILTIFEGLWGCRVFLFTRLPGVGLSHGGNRSLPHLPDCVVCQVCNCVSDMSSPPLLQFASAGAI